MGSTGECDEEIFQSSIMPCAGTRLPRLLSIPGAFGHTFLTVGFLESKPPISSKSKALQVYSSRVETLPQGRRNERPNDLLSALVLPDSGKLMFSCSFMTGGDGQSEGFLEDFGTEMR